MTSPGTTSPRSRLSSWATLLGTLTLLAACESEVSSGSGGGGQGDGDPPICPLPEIELELVVTFADGLDSSTADAAFDRSVSGSLVEVGSTIVIEGPAEGELTTIALAGTAAPSLPLGAEVELRVAYESSFDGATYLEIVDPLTRSLHLAVFTGSPRGVEGGAVQLGLEPTCTDEIVPEYYEQLVNTTHRVTITAEGASVELDEGEVAALGGTGLEVEHQGTFTGIEYDFPSGDRTGIVVRATP